MDACCTLPLPQVVPFPFPLPLAARPTFSILNVFNTHPCFHGRLLHTSSSGGAFPTPSSINSTQPAGGSLQESNPLPNHANPSLLSGPSFG
eukprot:scaffold311328_cov22-Tisochrysis_lutea.AAC.1